MQSHELKVSILIPAALKNICKKIESKGGKALIVGGVVRDAVMNMELRTNRESKDFDLEVYGMELSELKDLLMSESGEVGDRDESFGVLRAKVPSLHEPVDFAIAREEFPAEGKGHRFSTQTKLNPALSITEASQRRDLTIAALLYDPLTEVLYDPFGGIESIKKRKLEFVAPQTFKHDALRVLRVMQLAARLEFEVDVEVLKISKEMVERGDLDHLSKDAFRAEFFKMLKGEGKPSIGLNFALEAGVVRKYWPDLYALVGVKQPEKYHPEGDVWNHTLLVVDAMNQIVGEQEDLTDEDKIVLNLAALCHDLGKATTTKIHPDGKITAYGHEEAGIELTIRFLESLNVSKKICKRVTTLVSEHMKPWQLWRDSDAEKKDMFKAFGRLKKRLDVGGENLSNLILVAEADAKGKGISYDENISQNWKKWINTYR